MRTLLNIIEETTSLVKAKKEILIEDPDSESAKAILDKNELKTDTNKKGDKQTTGDSTQVRANGEFGYRESDR